MFLTGSFLPLHASFIENTSAGQLGLGICPGWTQKLPSTHRTMEAASFHGQRISLPYSYAYHIYWALRANVKWGSGCEFPPCPLLALDLAIVPLSPTSCAAAQQRWVTSKVNDKSRLGCRLEHTEVLKTLSSATGSCLFARILLVLPVVVCMWLCECVSAYFWKSLCWIYCTRVLLISVSLGVNAILDLWPYMVSPYERLFLCLTHSEISWQVPVAAVL